MRKTIP